MSENVIPFPTAAAPVIAESWQHVHTYQTYGASELILARDVVPATGEAPQSGRRLAILLTGLGPDAGFEVLAELPFGPGGEALAQVIAEAVFLFALHMGPEEPAA